MRLTLRITLSTVSRRNGHALRSKRKITAVSTTIFASSFVGALAPRQSPRFWNRISMNLSFSLTPFAIAAARSKIEPNTPENVHLS